MIQLTMIKCAIAHDKFCFICGEYMFASENDPKENEECRNIFGRKDDEVFVKAYKRQFHMDIFVDQNGLWSPSVCCSECCVDLLSSSSSSSSISSGSGTNKFIMPMIWKAPNNHPFDCYFCTTTITVGVNPYKKRSIIYANVSSISKPVRRRQQPQNNVVVESISSSNENNAIVEFETEFVCDDSCKRKISNDFVVNEDKENEDEYDEVELDDDDDDDDERNKDIDNDDDYDENYIDSDSDTRDDESDDVDDHDDLVKTAKKATKTTTTTTTESFQLTQPICNDLVRDLNLPKVHAELLVSRLKNMGLGKHVRITYYRNRNQQFDKLFSADQGLTYCTDIDALYKLFGYRRGHNRQVAKGWRLFIDSSKSALKAVLLHNGNRQPTVPIAYSKRLIESYENFKFLLAKINYTQYEWQIVADFKVIACLMGLKMGWPSYPCFLCLWNSRQPNKHYAQTKWPDRKETETKKEAEKFGVVSKALVKSKKILFPPLHIKLGLFQQFMKTMVKSLKSPKAVQEWLKSKRKKQNKTEQQQSPSIYEAIVDSESRNVDAIAHICHVILPKKSIPLILQGNVTGPEIRKILNNDRFIDMLTTQYKRVANALKMVISNFLGNHKSIDYKYHVNELVDSFREIGANMSLKLHFLRDHLTEFADILGDYSDEHGERFHQDIAKMEKRYAGMQFKHMLSDHCWFLLRESENYQTMWTRDSKAIYFQNVNIDYDSDDANDSDSNTDADEVDEDTDNA